MLSLPSPLLRRCRLIFAATIAPLLPRLPVDIFAPPGCCRRHHAADAAALPPMMLMLRYFFADIAAAAEPMPADAAAAPTTMPLSPCYAFDALPLLPPFHSACHLPCRFRAATLIRHARLRYACCALPLRRMPPPPCQQRHVDRCHAYCRRALICRVYLRRCC